MTNNKMSSEMWIALGASKHRFKRAAWFSVISSLLVLAPSAYMLEVYDRVVNSRSHTTLLMLTALVLVSYVVMEILEWARGGLLHEAGLDFDLRMRPRLFRVIFEANLMRVQGGTAQVMNDMRTIREFLGTSALTALMEAPISLVMMGLLFAINPWLGWSAVVGAIIQTLLTWLTERGTKDLLQAATKSSNLAQQYADSSLRNAQVIESMGMLHDIHLRWIRIQRQFLDLQALASYRGGGYQSISRFVQNVLASMLLGLGAWLYLHNQLNGGGSMLIIGSVLGGRALAPLVQIVAQWRSVVGVRSAWFRLNILLSAIQPKEEGMPLPVPKGLIQVENVVAGAPGAAIPIIRGLTFELRPGEVLVVVGPSAAGKTTLARLLVGLWPSANGKVRLDGSDIFNWNKGELGPHIGYLPQGVELFDGTLAENIARFGEVSRYKLETAAKTVGLHDFIMSLPEGYETQVGRDGSMLSGGQRQRVALARAIYGEPVFVVLDEPNSSLDEIGEAALAAAIVELKSRGTTFVIMTHRASILTVADKMLFLQDGAMRLFGPKDDVLATMKGATEAANANRLPAATKEEVV
jgi:ATP-binding cassette subfamily C exporter for protease/lipase